MNWKEIKEKYPKGFELVAQFSGNFDRVMTPEWYLQYNFNNRDLYSFFDEQEIIISIDPMERDTVFPSFLFRHTIFYNNGELFVDDMYRTPRKEAEEQAFIKAFEILEDVLTQES